MLLGCPGVALTLSGPCSYMCCNPDATQQHGNTTASLEGWRGGRKKENREGIVYGCGERKRERRKGKDCYFLPPSFLFFLIFTATSLIYMLLCCLEFSTLYCVIIIGIVLTICAALAGWRGECCCCGVIDVVVEISLFVGHNYVGRGRRRGLERGEGTKLRAQGGDRHR